VRILLYSFALFPFTLLLFSLRLSPLVTRFIFGTPGCTPGKETGFFTLSVEYSEGLSSKNPVSGHLCVSSIWENHCHCVNAFCIDKSAEIVWFIYGGVDADLGWVPA
jgi:hypothetical protein